MQNFTRRNFIKTSAGLIGATFISSPFDFPKKTPLLSFSTLGCPDWTYSAIVNFAAANGYDGIEIRGLQRELDLQKCKEFNSKQNILASTKLAKEKGIKIVDLGSSAQLHHTDVAERLKNLDQAKRFIDLASQLDCPFVRVFPNNFPKEVNHESTIELIAKGLNELGNYAKGSKVFVLMETHGDLVWIRDIEEIMEKVDASNTGIVWDIYNMWSVTKESPILAYKKLKRFILHTHIKDSKTENGNEKFVLPGNGDSPIFKAINALRHGGYNGYYSFEWEKLWHPEIEEPEIILSEYPKVMKEFYRRGY